MCMSESMNRNPLERMKGVLYPGNVKNHEKAIDSMGGIVEISEVFSGNSSTKIELKLRPNDMLSHPISGKASQVIGVLFKIRIKKNQKGKPIAKDDVTVVGLVSDNLIFEGIADFSYLPVVRNPLTNIPECIYEKLFPQCGSEIVNFNSSSDVPLFLPPPIFVKSDLTKQSFFRQACNKHDTVSDTYYRTRVTRKRPSVLTEFSLDAPIPEKSTEDVDTINTTEEEIDKIIKIFEKRPVCSIMVLCYETKIPPLRLRKLAPRFAYYYVSGPWKWTWVRYGYDVRKDFYSRYYQTLDFRVRRELTIKLENYNNKTRSKDKLCNQFKQHKDKDNNTDDANICEDCPYFEVDKLPVYRHCHYQYCDMKVPEIQSMLEKSRSPMSGIKCDLKTGWLPNGFDESVRNILLAIVKKNLNDKKLQTESNNEGEEVEYLLEIDPFSEDGTTDD